MAARASQLDPAIIGEQTQEFADLHGSACSSAKAVPGRRSYSPVESAFCREPLRNLRCVDIVAIAGNECRRGVRVAAEVVAAVRGPQGSLGVECPRAAEPH